MKLFTRTALALSLALAWLLPGAASAVPNPGTRLCFAALELRGLKGKARKQTHLKIVKHLREFGAEIPKDTYGMVIEPDCLQDPKCVIWALNDVEQVDGVLAVFATRKRKKVHVTVQFFHGKSGEKAFEEKFKARARRFPKRANFKRAIERGLEALQSGAVYQAPAPAVAKQAEPAAEPAATSEVVATAPPAEPSALDTTPPAAGTSAAMSSTSSSEQRAARSSSKADQGLPIASIVGWSGLGLGAALLATGALTGGLAMQIDQSLAAQCDQASMTCAYDLGEDYEQMRGLALATDVLMGTGVTALAIGAGAIVFALIGDEGE